MIYNKKNTAVVYIITQLELGGAQKVCLSLFQQTSDNHFTTYLITDKQGILIEHIKHLPRIYLCKKLASSNPLNNLRAITSIIKILHQIQQQHDHVIIHTHSSIAGIIGRWAGFFAGITTRIHTIHGYPFHDHQSWPRWFIYYVTELVASLLTTHFVCVSSYDAKRGIELFPRFAQKSSIIRAAVDIDRFEPAKKTTSHLFIFGTIACFKPQKNIFDLLQAFAMIHKTLPHIRLEIIGDGIQRPAIEAWISHHQLNSVITLHGWQHDVTPIMHNWHAFVLSSLWEGLPCAIVEARLKKLPVISYDTGGIYDIIHHQQNGLLCAQKNWKQLAYHMQSLAADHNLYHKLSGFQDDLTDFSLDTMIKEHTTLYHRIEK